MTFHHKPLRKPLAVLSVLVFALTASQMATAGSVHAGAKSLRAHIILSSTPAGQVLTTSSGHVIFIDLKEKTAKNACAQHKSCLVDWPPVTSVGQPVIGKGLKRSLVKLVPFKGKLKQVTYAGHLLHTYKFDDGPSVSFTFIGIEQFGAHWYGLTETGKLVKTPGG